MSRAASSPGRRAGPLAVVLVYLLGLAGALRSASLYHGDERFYTDAALAMERSGDYWLPRTAAGDARVEKPLVAYWAIVASQRLLGVGLWQARLPFALAMAGTILLAAAAARRLLADERAAPLVALVLAGNPDFLLLGSRSTPDALLCFGVALALDGAARVLLEGRARGALGFWVGAGLAAATKGLWGLLVTAFVLLGARRARIEPERRARLYRPGALLAGTGLAALGIAPLFLAGAGRVVEAGGGDQLRATPSMATALRNLAEYGPAPVVHFLPWSLLVLVALASRTGRLAARRVLARPAVRAALAWWLVLVGVFLLGTQRRVRYLAPAQAGLALALAALLLECAALERPGLWLRRAAVSLAGVASLACLALALSLAPRAPLVGLLLLVPGALGIVQMWRARGSEPAAALVACGWSVALAGLAFQGLLRPMLSRSPFEALLSAVDAAGVAPLTIATDGLHDSVAARLRLVSARRIDVQPLEASDPPALLLTDAAREAEWRARRFTPLSRFDAPGGPSTAEVRAWWASGEEGLPRAPHQGRWVLLRREP